MKISPMDIQKQTFGPKFRGIDPEEVRSYLTLVAEEVAALQRERDVLEHGVRGEQVRRVAKAALVEAGIVGVDRREHCRAGRVDR